MLEEENETMEGYAYRYDRRIGGLYDEHRIRTAAQGRHNELQEIRNNL